MAWTKSTGRLRVIGIAFTGFVNNPAEKSLEETRRLYAKSQEPTADVTLHVKARGPEPEIRTVYPFSSFFSVTLC